MPCNSDYLNASYREIALSQVACLIGELNGIPINRDHWRGYHPDVYNKHVDGDKLVAKLCSMLRGKDVAEYSLEMQMWWRDHQEADRRRIEREKLSKKQKADREWALAKLTADEKKLLGLK